MKLLIIRHAAAVPRGTAAIADDERPLTRRGQRRFRRAARGLANLVEPPDVVLTSPLPRALETARIAAKAWGLGKPTAEKALAHGDVDDILAGIERHRDSGLVALVGHEPTLSALLARLLASADGSRFALRKGGAALVDLPAGAPVRARLVWYLRPRILRALGRT